MLLHWPHGVGVQVGGCRVQLRAAPCGGEGLCLLLPAGGVHSRFPHASMVPVALPGRWQSLALADVPGE